MGSEMCIRDSAVHAAGRRAGDELGARGGAQPHLVPRAAGRSVDPVSYTHLTLPTSDLV